MQTLIQIAAGFVVFFALFTLVEKLFPAIRQKPVFRQGCGLDIVYWVLAPTINALIKKAAVIVALVLVALALGLKLDASIKNGFGPVAQQPLGWLVLEVLVAGDFVGYWTHRLFHSSRLWKIHAVHHSSTELDWLSSVRVHPFNQAINSAISVAVLVALGFPLDIMKGYLPFIIIYGVMLHANVPWSFGPLRYAIASPRFHRWHHTSEDHGMNKNFAGLFPLFDLLFGTFYMPRGEQPKQFGVRGNDVPESLWAQMVYPFRRAAKSKESTAG